MEAPAHITCQDCRQRWERYHFPDGRPIVHSPIGYATIYTRQGDKEAYQGTARSYADLRQLVSSLPVGTCFTVRLCCFLDIIGQASYTRTDGGVQVLDEDEVTEGLHLTLESEILHE